MRDEEFEFFIENDKFRAPFLLAASFNGLLEFDGYLVSNGILYWKFSPRNVAQKLVEQLSTKTDPRIPAMDLFEATSTWWKQISGLRNGEIYGSNI